jgi:hypothetical protein
VPDDSLEPPAVIYGVDVRFTNVAPVAADEITLRVKYNGKVATMHDFGKFQQGVQIDHTLTHLPIDEYDGDDSSCRLTAVHFVNGTSWYAAAPRRQSTTDAEQPSR